MSAHEDPLVFMPESRWAELKCAFKSDWPRSICGYLRLEGHELLLKSDAKYDSKVYSPYGDVTNGMVTVTNKGKLCDITIHCPKDDTTKLEEALNTTMIIDWKKCDEIPVIAKHVMNCMKRVYLKKNLKIDPQEYAIKTNTFVLDKDAPQYDVSLPPEFSFGLLPLDPVILALINESWPDNYPGSEKFFEILLKAKLGYGLYNGEELVAWVFLN